MPYLVETTQLPEVLLLQPKVFSDERGFFFESFNAREFQKATGLAVEFVQDNHSLSQRGVLRGLHFQRQHPQGKLIRVTQGRVFDVAVDIRPDSPHFGRWTGHYLDAQRHQQIWIPPGFAHGFLVVSESAEVNYKTTDYWVAGDEGALIWNDPDLGIEWPLREENVAPQLSTKDAAAPGFKQI